MFTKIKHYKPGSSHGSDTGNSKGNEGIQKVKFAVIEENI